MSAYNKMVSGQVSSAGGDTNVVIPFTPDFIEIFNETRIAAASGVIEAEWISLNGQGAAKVLTAPAVTSFVPAGGSGFSTFEGALSLQYSGAVKITSMTAANPILVTTASNHGLVSGNVIEFQSLYQTATTGMQQIAKVPFEVTVTGATTFTVAWDATGSNYTAIAAGGLSNMPEMRRILYPSLYVPGVSPISAITLGATTTVVTTRPHNLVVGSQVAFRIESEWGTSELNSLPNVVIPGSSISGFVTSVTDRNTVVVNINSSSYTALDVNQTFASFPGLLVPQIVAIGDINYGTGQFAYGSPTVFNGWSTAAVSTINGPAIAGAFINATMRGFIIGSAVAGTLADVISYRAYAHDANSL